jgi:AraC family transcriptional regulator
MAEAQAETSREHRLGGSFYGSVQRKLELHDAIFTDLQHLSARKMPAHSHELAFFALLLEGDYREQYGRQQTYFGPFTISFRPAGIPHQDEVGPRGVKFFEIELRPNWQPRLKECSGTLDVPLNDCEGGELLWLGMKLFRETRGSAITGDLCIETLLAELLAAVARMPRENTKDAPRWLNYTVDKLKAECCERITLEELGKDAGVHPVHLSRVFRRCMGEGIGEYVHRLRIRAACEQMLTPEMPLAEIGLATGFADQSHFTRTFRKITGMSPGAFRTVLAARA